MIMCWILETPGYEVDDPREEVLQECLPGHSSAVDDGETDVLRTAISAVLRTIDNEELVSRVDATETQLRQLLHHMK